MSEDNQRFKVGDRVQVVDEGSPFVGTRSIVTGIRLDKDDIEVYEVYVNSGLRWFAADQLELIPDPCDAQIAQLTAEQDRLRKALEPFAKLYNQDLADWGALSTMVGIEWLRAAKKALDA